MFATILRQLAAHEVQRLNAIGPFVDHGNPGVAGELGHAPFFDIAVTAIDLLRLDRHVIALIGQKALDDRGQQRDEAVCVFVALAMCRVDHLCAPQNKRARAFCKALLIHQGPTDIRVYDQRIGRAVGVLDACDVAPLQTVFRIFQRVLIRDFGLCEALHANAQTGFVHHGEHGAHTLVRLAQQIACRFVVIHDAGGIAVDAHLFFDLADRDAVAGAQIAVVIDHDFGYDKERHALDAVWPTRDLCQNQMDDVFGHVVIARRDKDLLAGNLVRSVILRHRLGPHQTQIGSAMRFGQVHRAGPVTADHLRQPLVLLGVRSMRKDGRGRTVGETLIHHKCLI